LHAFADFSLGDNLWVKLVEQPLLAPSANILLRSGSDSVYAMREGGVKAKSEKDSQVISESVAEERIMQALDFVTSLKDVSLEVRRKEAGKPLYLRRYE
jgi:hypothetical protein